MNEAPVDYAALASYSRVLGEEGARSSVPLGRPRFDDDAFDAKLEIVLDKQPSIVSFTFGCPCSEIVEALHNREIAVWVTITDPEEARMATDAGADALIAQGVEAGGHRGSFNDLDGQGELSLLPLVRLTTHATSLPLVASGGVADGAGVAAALAAGACAVQIGTGFMRCPEAGTTPVHRDALAGPAATELTRAFTGRRARGITNQFMLDYGSRAPSAYPHVHYLTAPLRAAARKAQDADRMTSGLVRRTHSRQRSRPPPSCVAGAMTRNWRWLTPHIAGRTHDPRLGPAPSEPHPTLRGAFQVSRVPGCMTASLDVSPPNRAGLFEQVASQLEGLILAGKIEVGAKLPPEGVLASQFGVSRPVVREALAQLRERGLTETVNGSGTYVRRPDSEGLTDVLLRHLHFGSLAAPQAIESLYEARIAVEVMAARLAVRPWAR